MLLLYFFFQARCNTKPEVDYGFPLHSYRLNALSLFCGLLCAIGLRHRGPLISNSVNIGGDDKAFYIGLRRHGILPLVYSSSRMGFHYIFSSPRSRPDSRCIHYREQWRLLCLIPVILLFLINGLSESGAQSDLRSRRLISAS